MTFAAPYLLFALLAVPLALAGYVLVERRRAERSAAWSRRALQPNIVREPARNARHLPALLFLLGLACLLVGLARPQRVSAASRADTPTVVLAFDVSGSMAATDVAPSRLRVARRLAIDLLHELPAADRVAVITFGNKVRLLQAPTTDRAAVIARLPQSVTPLSGTAIGDGVRRAVAVIVGAAGQTTRATLVRPGSTLVFSDGMQTAGGTTLDAAGVTALVDYIPVHTLAVGTKRGFVVQPVTFNGSKTTVQLQAPVDPVPLRRLARQTGGRFFDAATVTPEALKSVYANLTTYTSAGHGTRELSAITAGVALALMVAGIAVSGLWFGRVA